MLKCAAVGVGEFLSSKAENEWILSERRRENWEMENYPQGEIREMIDIYQKRGMSREDATAAINIMAKYKDFFVDVMMAGKYKDVVLSSGFIFFCANYVN